MGLERLPDHLKQEFMSLLELVDGEYEVKDQAALISFVQENCDEYPELLELIQVDEEELIRYYRETGKVPPGVKIIEKTDEGGNVVGLRVHHSTDDDE